MKTKYRIVERRRRAGDSPRYQVQHRIAWCWFDIPDLDFREVEAARGAVRWVQRQAEPAPPDVVVEYCPDTKP